MSETFGEFLRKSRKEKGLTLIELSKKSGVSNPYISQIENNKFKPTPKILEKLANGLEIDYMILMKEAGFLDQTVAMTYFSQEGEGRNVVKFEMLENFINMFSLEIKNAINEEEINDAKEAFTEIFHAMMTNYKLDEILAPGVDVKLSGEELTEETKEKLLAISKILSK